MPTLTPPVLLVPQARSLLTQRREEIKSWHSEGRPPREICGDLLALFEQVVLGLFDSALARICDPTLEAEFRGNSALVAHGGLGRGDVAPFSDLDVMLLIEPSAAKAAEPVAARFVQDVFDVRMQIGHSVRTVREACTLAAGDASIFTSLIEARLLEGSEALFQRFQQRFRQMAAKRKRGLLTSVEQARGAERAQFGETVYLLEPNIKRSRGGLRDWQLVRWIGYLTHGESDLAALCQAGAISSDDLAALNEAHVYLLKLRNQLHFDLGRPHDVLDRGEQLRLAQLWGFAGHEGVLPVEEFMRDYFRHTRAVSQIANWLVTGARPTSRIGQFLEPLVSHNVEGDFRVGPRSIAATSRGLVKITADLAEILRLADFANQYDTRIAHATCEAIRAAAARLPDELSPAAAERFLSLLSQPARLGELLRLLHEIGVLEKIIPAFHHAWCLLQFNEYHKFTVDEHCIHAVEQATAFLSDAGPLGEAYRGLPKKWLLHLALLIHDLGKGFAEDHSEVGARIAVETALRLRLAAGDAETLRFLVHKHLLLSHLAFRRDADDAAILGFAREVCSVEMLSMLYVLTAADFAAVGPGVLNDWKRDVLTSIYRRTRRRLSGGDVAGEQEVERRREEVLGILRDNPMEPRPSASGSEPPLPQGRGSDALSAASQEANSWFRDQVQALSPAYLEEYDPADIAADLQALRLLPLGGVATTGRYLEERGAVEYVVSTYEDVAPGVFHRLTGALTSKGLEILGAEINTLAHGLIVDRFTVHDGDFRGPPPDFRVREVEAALKRALLEPSDQPPRFREVWRTRSGKRPADLLPQPTRVSCDNSLSPRHTVIDVFANDRPGLLYTITRNIFELGLSVWVAKIGTYYDQVVDVFYVTDDGGRKLPSDGRLDDVRQRLLQAIAAFET